VYIHYFSQKGKKIGNLVIIHGSNVIIAVLAAKRKFAKNEKISVFGATNFNPHAEKK